MSESLFAVFPFLSLDMWIRQRLTIMSTCCGLGHLGRLLLLRVHAAGKRQGWVPEDYQSGQFADGSVLPEEEF